MLRSSHIKINYFFDQKSALTPLAAVLELLFLRDHSIRYNFRGAAIINKILSGQRGLMNSNINKAYISLENYFTDLFKNLKSINLDKEILNHIEEVLNVVCKLLSISKHGITKKGNSELILTLKRELKLPPPCFAAPGGGRLTSCSSVGR
jgi:hypothetical protein